MGFVGSDVCCDQCGKSASEVGDPCFEVSVVQLGEAKDRCSWWEDWCAECVNAQKFVCGESMREQNGIPQIVEYPEWDQD